MRHYATVCRKEQLTPLVGSMLRHCEPFTLHVLAWDWDEMSRWEQLSSDRGDYWIKYTRGDAFLMQHPQYMPRNLPGEPRSKVDTVATVRWQFYFDVMMSTLEPLTAIDGDIWFWSSPESMYQEIGDAEMAVSPHRIPSDPKLPGVKFETHRQYGLYNAGFVYMANPSVAAEMAKLNWEWSYTKVVEKGGHLLFGDQGWLELVAGTRRAHVIQHPGVNVGPWNIHRYAIMKASNGVFVGSRDDMWPLVAYHYSSLRREETPAGPIVVPANAEYELTPYQTKVIYEPYVKALGWL